MKWLDILGSYRDVW